jgi:hypothetical protein
MVGYVMFRRPGLNAADIELSFSHLSHTIRTQPPTHAHHNRAAQNTELMPLIYKVVQIWPGWFVCKQVTVCPGHIWTTLYIVSSSSYIVSSSSCKRTLWPPKARIANYGDLSIDNVQWKYYDNCHDPHDNVDKKKCVVIVFVWLHSNHEE